MQQKYLIVTCNYIAREQGVSKMMSVKEALEKCPDLVLVRGEDLNFYRETSNKVTGNTHIRLLCVKSAGQMHRWWK